MTFGGDEQPTGPIQGIKNFIKNEWQWVSIVIMIITVAFGVGVNYATNTQAAERASEAATAAKDAANKVAAALVKHEEVQDASDKDLNDKLYSMDAKLNQLIGRLGGPLSMNNADSGTLKEATVNLCLNAECPADGK
jgi:hypothetical protein